jgi:hypothetical protein
MLILGESIDFLDHSPEQSKCEGSIAFVQLLPFFLQLMLIFSQKQHGIAVTLQLLSS